MANPMNPYIQNLYQILYHKLAVFRECFKLGVPWLGLIHDLSKLSPIEQRAYTRHFITEVACDDCVEWMRGLHHHYTHNRHHWNYYVIVSSAKDNQRQIDVNTLPMPKRYIKEMVADWRATSGIQTPSWYLANRDKMILHSLTRLEIERLLGLWPRRH